MLFASFVTYVITTACRPGKVPWRLRHPHALDVRELPDTVFRQLSAIPRALDASEWEAWIGFHELIHENAADLDVGDDALGALEVPGPEGDTQSECESFARRMASASS